MCVAEALVDVVHLLSNIPMNIHLFILDPSSKLRWFSNGGASTAWFFEKYTKYTFDLRIIKTNKAIKFLG